MGKGRKDLAIWSIRVAIVAGLAGALWYGIGLPDQGQTQDQRLDRVASNSVVELTNGIGAGSNVVESPPPGNATNAAGAKRVTPGKPRSPVFFGK